MIKMRRGNRSPSPADQTESEWKFSLSHTAETAIYCAAHVQPHLDRSAWASAERVLAQFGERYASCALPNELGLTLFSNFSEYFPRELWLITATYAVEFSAAWKDSLQNVVVARAYCLYLAGRTTDGALILDEVLQRKEVDQEHVRWMIDAANRLLHAQFYAEAGEIYDKLSNCKRVYPFHREWALNQTFCASMQGHFVKALKPWCAIGYHLLLDDAKIWFNVIGAWLMAGSSANMEMDVALMAKQQAAWFIDAAIRLQNRNERSRVNVFIDGLKSHIHGSEADRLSLSEVQKNIAETLRREAFAYDFPDDYPSKLIVLFSAPPFPFLR
jgi:hypothetical protein